MGKNGCVEASGCGWAAVLEDNRTAPACSPSLPDHKPPSLSSHRSRRNMATSDHGCACWTSRTFDPPRLLTHEEQLSQKNTDGAATDVAREGRGGWGNRHRGTDEGGKDRARAFQGEAEGLNHKSCSEKSSVNIFHLNTECI